MTDLNEYLAQKRDALQKRTARIDAGELGALALNARVSAEGRSGVRRIRIRDFQVLTDSPPDFAGYNLGPSSPELQLGVLGSCLTHSFLIQAANLGIPIESIDVEVNATIDPRAGHTKHPDVPAAPQGISYTVHIASSASPSEIDALEVQVNQRCPILNLLRSPQHIVGSVEHAGPKVLSTAPSVQAA